MTSPQIGRAIAVVGLSVLGSLGARAQEGAFCSIEDLLDPPRVIYRCQNGLLIEAETREGLSGFLPPESAEDRSLEVTDGAVLIDLEPGGGPFQILTPYAIASVRGTTYVVDALPDRTDVFVVEGAVSVSRADGSDPVELVAGEGVNVSKADVVEVRTWPAERVSALLARFAR